MTVSSVSGVNFKGTAYTKNNNEYKKTYVGRVLGTGLGLGLGIAALRAQNGASKIVEFTEKYKGIIKNTLNNISKDNPAMKETVQKFVSEGSKILKSINIQKVLKYATPILAAWLFVGGYIKGAIIDKVINAKRANNADKVATVA